MEVFVEDLRTGNKTMYHLDLPGIYQTKNIVTVLEAIELLKQKGWDIEQQHVINALHEVKKSTGLSGRWEVIKEKPIVVLEVAHNEDGIHQMLDHLKQLRYQKLHIVFGVVKDKDINAILSLLPADAIYYFTQAHIPRALDAVQLQTQAKKAGLDGNIFEDVNEAIMNALLHASVDDLILVCGSIFLVAEVIKEGL
jgi:dihydrofolate synthase / folylpolyglutamate synthase